ncbi:MAG: protein ndvB [Parachlamydiaceae bacterium]|nr:protein ndvB [Parachlamydiaceae bacterium]
MNTVLGFYQNPETAADVLNKFRKKGLRRVAMIRRNSNKEYTIHSYKASTPLLISIISMIGLFLFAFFSEMPKMATISIIVLLGIFIGWMADLYLFKISPGVVNRFKKLLVGDETLIIAEINTKDVREALGLLREVESGHPISFLLRCDHFPPSDREGIINEPLTAEEMNEKAAQLALSLNQVGTRVSHYPSLLKSLKQCENTLKEIRHNVAESEYVEQTITSSAEWLLDNNYVIQGNIEEIYSNLPQGFYKTLPTIIEGSYLGLPRIYLVAKELINATANRLNHDNIIAFLNSYQAVSPLTIGELWALSLMLRFRLIENLQYLAVHIDRRLCEGELAGLWGNRLLNVARREPEALPKFLDLLAKECPKPSEHFAEELMDHLFDEEAVLPLLRKWFEEKFNKSISDVIHREQVDKSVEQVSFSSAVISLITLSQLSWQVIFEATSVVDQILGKDPDATYLKMDFATRDRYRQALEEISKHSHASETQVARLALEKAELGREGVEKHVGYYLIDQGRSAIEDQVQYYPHIIIRIRRWILKNPTLTYLSTVGLTTFLIEIGLFYLLQASGANLSETAIVLFFALLISSEYCIQIINYIISRFIPPFILPKLAFESSLPAHCKTFVVVPTLLSSTQTISDNLNRLEIHYLANKDPSMLFGLFVDFKDAAEQRTPSDQSLLDEMIQGIKKLENKYGKDTFFLLHRERVWNQNEGVWMGWERKRGKLEILNRYLITPDNSDINLLVGSKESLANIIYVITLDSDTELPKDSAKKLVATLAHPLNAPRLSSNGTLERGYAILQPRVSTNFIQSKRSYFTYIFSDETTTDPYNLASSNLYEDLWHEGTYHGKGIYDIKSFESLLRGKFPEGQILSHDLIEGCYAKVAFTSDILLLDSFPEDYLTWSNRLHRWMRGDWQIIDWLFPKVRNGSGQKTSNTLSIIDRWKIFDNLRRALLPVFSLTVLLLGWFVSSQPLFWSLFVVVMYFVPFIISTLSNAFTYAYKDIGIDALRAILNVTLIPQQAWLSIDAFVRTLYRRHISHRHLLQWQSGLRSDPAQHTKFILKLSCVSMLAIVLCAILIELGLTSAFWAALPLCILWIVSPLIIYVLDAYSFAEPSKQLSLVDQMFLRHIARKTWRYFDDFVGPQSNWLPPDNYQAALQVEVAPRTSPTNIGLWLLCVLSAKDFHYITTDDGIDRLIATFQTIRKLEQFEGHLLNWYDIITLNPLYPRYVSTVDSGNLLASLWTAIQGIDEIAQQPILPLSLFDGLRDTFDLLSLQTSTKNISLKNRLGKIKNIIYFSPLNLPSVIKSIREALREVQELITLEKIESDEGAYWAKKLDEQLHEWDATIIRYFSWIDILNEVSPNEQNQIDPQFSHFCNILFKSPVSLVTLASNNLNVEIERIHSILNNKIDSNHPLHKWKQRLQDALNGAQWLAGEKLGQIQELLSQVDRLSEEKNMKFLYNTDRKLFSIGYHVDDCKLDNSYYDLLASEARISSLVSIAKGDIPQEHWWALGRSYHIVYGQKALLSWGGTMFEYLMPLLFNEPHSESLLGQACQSAVACQIAYGNLRGIPWGISEAAFSEIDVRKTYQYRSFGVPGLGFKRDLEEDLVVSPYSSALALAISPNEAVANMRRLAKKQYNMLGIYGYYESIDFTRQQGPQGERGVIVYAYMAHHQGMSLMAINNLLNDHIIPKRFHADPRIAGVEALLCERVPSKLPIGKGSRKDMPLTRLTHFTSAPIMGRVDTPHSITPKVNLLSNGVYSLMMTNSGGGYSRWKNFDITRWFADTTCDNWGSYCYIKDVQSGAVWSTGYHPTHTKGRNYSMSFKADKVELRRRDNYIETFLEIVVSPEDDAEIRMITLANLSQQSRELELTSYSELVLAPHAADRAHPAFNKLFIQTEALPELSGLLAFRRPRSPDEQQIWVGHVIASDQPPSTSFQYETDRNLFIGRGNSLEQPSALNKELSNSAGTVLDPIFSLRYRLSLAPGQRVHIAFVTIASENRENTVALVKRYADINTSRRAIELAWNHAQLELRHLRIHQEEVQLFQKLASRVLYPQGQLRPSNEQLRRNRLGQSHLWAYGISGDLPIVAITVADFHDIELVKQVLTAHAFWRIRGLKVDLVILNEEATGYDHPLFDQLQRLINAHSNHTDIERAGGIYLINYEQVPEEDLNLILSIARANLVAARGSLRQQLVSPVEFISYPPRLQVDKAAKDFPSITLPFLELSYFNGLGGFTHDGREYVIYLTANTHTPAPWINVIANSKFGTIVSEAGLGSTWYGNSQNNRLTPWTNDPLLNPICDSIYIRDNHLGTYWTPTPGPIRELDPYRIRHGQGYSRFEHNSHGIDQDLLIYVPVDENGGLPLRVQRLKLKNNSPKTRHLSLFSYSEWVLGENREESQLSIITQWDPESQALFAYNRYHPDFSSYVAFVCSVPISKSFTANRTEFLGRNNDRSHPAALRRKGLAGTTGGAYDPCAALNVDIELNPNEEKEVVFVMGYAPDEATARALIMQCRENNFAEHFFQETLKWWNKLLGTIQISTPEPDINFSVNRWLLYQNLSCRYWGRSAFYQSSGAYGFRDQLQDVAALIYTAPNLARDHILTAAARQFVEGDVQHWWHATSKGGGVRTRISDDLLWLPFITAQYVRVTNDKSILDEVIPFIKGELLKPDQHEIYFVPEISDESATLLEHCRRSINKGITEGPHALPLIGGGDWNDGMNRVGIEGKGESVWLAWFLIHVMNDFAELLSITNQEGSAEGFRTQAKRLATVIEENAWDGNWYRRAYFDDGSPLGSQANQEDTIDSLPQSWAVISGAADPNRAATAMQSVEEHLIDRKEGLVLLLKPPFNTSMPDPGYIKGYPPGVRENGGQYTHGSLWVPMAFARRGEGEKAVGLLQMMHPLAHAKTLQDAEKFKVEPYVVAADIYALPGQMGRGGWTWYTGSAGWMYRIWIEEIFGFKLRGNLLSLHPVLPPNWEHATILYTFKETSYTILIENPNHLKNGNLEIKLDENILEKNEILLVDDRKDHTIIVTIR